MVGIAVTTWSLSSVSLLGSGQADRVEVAGMWWRPWVGAQPVGKWLLHILEPGAVRQHELGSSQCSGTARRVHQPAAVQGTSQFF